MRVIIGEISKTLKISKALKCVCLFVGLVFILASASEHPDYCKDDFNCMGFTHIGCNNLLLYGVSFA